MQTDRGIFDYRRAAFSSIFKSRVGNILVKSAVLHTLRTDLFFSLRFISL
jgi:hypothetical protein